MVEKIQNSTSTNGLKSESYYTYKQASSEREGMKGSITRCCSRLAALRSLVELDDAQ